MQTSSVSTHQSWLTRPDSVQREGPGTEDGSRAGRADRPREPNGGVVTGLRTYGVYVLVGHGELVADVPDPDGQQRLYRPKALEQAREPDYIIGQDGVVRNRN